MPGCLEAMATKKQSTATSGEPTVFISSTSEDLAEYRAAAEHAAKLAGFRPAMMEYFGASGRPSLTECLARVSNAHVVVAISAHRYGWVPDDQPDGDDKSITWLECAHGDGRGAEVLPFLIDPEAAWPVEHRDRHRLDEALVEGTAMPELLAAVQRDMGRLRDFKAWLSTRPRSTFTSSEDLKTKVLDALHKWRARHLEFRPVAAPERMGYVDRGTLEPYLRLLAGRVSHLPLRGIDIGASDPAGKAAPVELSRVYVNLLTTARDEADAEGPRTARATRMPDPGMRGADATPVSALDAAIRHERVVLLGNPGSGKSTFVSYVALCLAQHILAPAEGWLGRLAGWPDGDMVPVVVTLRDLARSSSAGDAPAGEARTVWTFITSRLEGDQLAVVTDALEAAVEAGLAIVFFDGLDEVTGTGHRAFVRDAVQAFMERYHRCRYLITCRTLSYQDPAFQLPDIPTFRLAPFDDDGIDAFITAWYAELRRLHAVPEHRETDLVDALQQAVRRPDLARLAPSPLLLTVMALVHTHKGGLPDARAQLYEDTVDLLLWRWEQVKAGSERSLLRDLLDQADAKDVDLKRALWALAFEAHRDGGASDDADSLADIAEHRLVKVFAGLHPTGSKDWAEALVEVVRSRAGLLIERTPEIFSFPHRTGACRPGQLARGEPARRRVSGDRAAAGRGGGRRAGAAA